MAPEFQLIVTYMTCFTSLTHVNAAPWLSPNKESTTTQPFKDPLPQAFFSKNGQGVENVTGSSSGTVFDFSTNQGNTETKPPEEMFFDFSTNQDKTKSNSPSETTFEFGGNTEDFATGDQPPNGMSLEDLLLAVAPKENDEDDGDDFWDKFIDSLNDCDESCDEFQDVCSGEGQCELLDNCTTICNWADGTQSVLYPKDLRDQEGRKCTKEGKPCVHGKCLEDQSCKCDIGYEGDICDVKQCELPCLHGGICIKLRDGFLDCACSQDWQGSFCEKPKCRLPCVRGSCLYSPNNDTEYCNCPFGWTGDYCEEEIPDPAEQSRIRALIVGITVPAVCLLALIISWYILWRKRVIFVFKIINMFKAYEDDDDKMYDAYVSLTDADFMFVKHVLQPKLEEMGHKLYLHARDGVAGDVKSEEILEAVKKSRRCIMLLSADYISNEWCRFEYLIAQHETCIKLKQRIIPILMDDIDKDKKKMDKTLRFIVDSVKCLRYPKVPQELSPMTSSVTPLQPDSPKSKDLSRFEKKQAKFWERLRLNMPKKRDTEKERCPLSAGNAKRPYSNQNTKKGLGVLFSKLSKTLPVQAPIEKSSSTDFSFVEPTSSSDKLSEANPVNLINVTARGDPKLDSFYGDTLERSLTGDCSERSIAVSNESLKAVATEDVGHIYIRL